MKKNIFLIGLNDFNLARLQSIPDAADCNFLGLLDYHDVVGPEQYNIRYLLEKAEARLRAFDGSIDAIIGYMDFPVSTMVPVLCEKFRVRSSSVRSFLKCEHKYWSRLEQRASIPEHVPRFTLFDPFADDALTAIELDYPFWIKPVKSFGSYLGFRINSEQEFSRAVSLIRREIGRISEPFNDLLDYVGVEMPREVADIGGHYCLAEELIGGHQCTMEGCRYNGQLYVYGVVDSIRYPGTSVFQRYEYPSRLPERITARLETIASRFLEWIDYNNSAFNLEFFWDERRDRIWFLEINTRVAQHHSYLFEAVNGISNHEIPIALALDRPPQIPAGKGQSKVAAVFFNREFEDGVVEKVPDRESIRRIEEQYPGAVIQIEVEKGMKLSELPEQDSYSYIHSLVYLGAQNREQLLADYNSILAQLDFTFRR